MLDLLTIVLKVPWNLTELALLFLTVRRVGSFSLGERFNWVQSWNGGSHRSRDFAACEGEGDPSLSSDEGVQLFNDRLEFGHNLNLGDDQLKSAQKCTHKVVKEGGHSLALLPLPMTAILVSDVNLTL